ncbi:hypothetical protein Tco_0686638 [Tanacetum coccineum]
MLSRHISRRQPFLKQACGDPRLKSNQMKEVFFWSFSANRLWLYHDKPSINDSVLKLNLILESLGLVPQSSNTKFVCSKEDDGEVMFIEIIRDDDGPQYEGPNEGEGETTEGPANVEMASRFTRDAVTTTPVTGSGFS